MSSSRLKARRATWHLTTLDVGSTVKFGVVAALSGGLFSATMGVALWGLAGSTGSTGKVEGFLQAAGAGRQFHFASAAMLFGLLVLSTIGMVFSILVWTFLVLLFNALASRVGGIRLTVLEEETARPRGEMSVGR